MTCVVAQEIGAPAAVASVVWRLLTNREVQNTDAIVELIDRARWEFEMFFLVLKTGCKVEALQQRAGQASVLYMVVAWRIARLMQVGQNLP